MHNFRVGDLVKIAENEYGTFKDYYDRHNTSMSTIWVAINMPGEDPFIQIRDPLGDATPYVHHENLIKIKPHE